MRFLPMMLAPTLTPGVQPPMPSSRYGGRPNQFATGCTEMTSPPVRPASVCANACGTVMSSAVSVRQASRVRMVFMLPAFTRFKALLEHARPGGIDQRDRQRLAVRISFAEPEELQAFIGRPVGLQIG